MSKNLKNNIISFILGALIFGSIGIVSAFSLFADNVGFTPYDNTWNVDNVESAINDLYANQAYYCSYIKSIKPMTSNTSADGVASSNSVLSSSAVYKAFDGNTNTGVDSTIYHSADYVFPSTNGIYVRFAFNTPRKINKAIWYGRGVAYNSAYIQTPAKYKFQASNDATNWVDLSDLLTNSVEQKGLYEEVRFKNIDTYKYYQMVIYDSNDPNYRSVAIDEIQYYE